MLQNRNHQRATSTPACEGRAPAFAARAVIAVSVAALTVGLGALSLVPAPALAAPSSPEVEPAASASEVLSDADAAFDAGDHDRALTLYQRALAKDPVDLQALRRAGLLLGWAGRAKEAVPLLEKAVRLERTDRPTRLQLARVYSWSQSWDKSIAAYDMLVAEDPTDVATAVERARVLAWAGRHAASEAAYRAILGAHPDSAEARLGLAQTLGWEGRLEESEAIYREEQGRSPTGARLGLARLDLLRGNTGEALRAARAELATDPNNEDAREIENAALAALRPSIGLGVELTDDTDDNRNIAASATGSFHAGGAVDIDVTAAWLRQEGRDGELQRLTSDDDKKTLSSESLGVALGFAAGRRARITIAAAGERLGRYDRPAPVDDRGSETAVSGYAALRVITRPVTVRLTLAHEVPKWTAFITERNLRWDHAVVGFEGRLPWALDWGLSADVGRITDGAADNNRFMGLATIARRFELGEGYSLTPRYAFRRLAYERNLNDGYFDPRRYSSHVLGLDLAGIFAAGRVEWVLGAGAGLERFRHDAEDEAVCDVFDDAGDAAAAAACRRGNDAGDPALAPAARYLQGADASDRNTVLNFAGRLTWNIREATSLTLYASHNESAAQTAAGFESNTYGAAARIRF